MRMASCIVAWRKDSFDMAAFVQSSGSSTRPALTSPATFFMIVGFFKAK